MAVIGITTGVPKSIYVHYLAEDLWIDWDMIPMVYLNPLIIWVRQDISKLSIILHGKPSDIRDFSFTPQNDNRIIKIKKEGEFKEDCTCIITSDLLMNNEYLRRESWDEYDGILGEGDKPTLGLAKNIHPILEKHIESIEWLHPEMKQCSILEITFKENLKKFEYYGLRMGIRLEFPYGISKLKRKFRMGVTYKVHYCTFKGISENDKITIKEKYLYSDKERFAPIIFNVSPCVSVKSQDSYPVLEQKNKSSCTIPTTILDVKGKSPCTISTPGLDTSSLAIYTYRGHLFSRVISRIIAIPNLRRLLHSSHMPSMPSIFEVDYRIDESATTLSCSKNIRAFKPFSADELSPGWRSSLWTQKDFRFSLSGPENYCGYEFKMLLPDWDIRGHEPITVAVNKFDGSKGLIYLALYIAISNSLYSLLNKFFDNFVTDNTVNTTSFILSKILIILLVAALALSVISIFFGKEVSN